MKLKSIFACIVVVLCALSMVSCIKEQPGVELQVGDFLPDFEVVLNDGTTITGEQLRQVPSCVFFFHTSCPDCQQALPLLQRIYDEFADSLAIVLISRQQPEDEISAYWADQGFTMPYSAQLTREIYELFAQERVPRIYLSPAGGQIQAIFTDSPVPTYEILLEQVNKIL